MPASPAADKPILVATIGLHGSASTWVFNVVRELLVDAAGEGGVLAAYADQAADMPDAASRAGRHLVLKSHQGSAALDALLAEQGAVILLSVRDPRDAVLSMVQRFRESFPRAAHALARDCARVIALAEAGHPVLRYEDRFFADPATVARLAVQLGLAPTAAAREAIFARYTTEAVRDFTRTVPDLPPERLARDERVTFARLTQIHHTHIGDARSGKWRDPPGNLPEELSRFFAPALERLGYEL